MCYSVRYFSTNCERVIRGCWISHLPDREDLARIATVSAHVKATKMFNANFGNIVTDKTARRE